MVTPKITTSRQLARLAGVSHTTVLRAFRGDPKVEMETRDRILELAKEHGYRPNPLISLGIQAMQKAKSGMVEATLAFVHSNAPMKSWKGHPHLSPYWTGITEHAAELGFGVDEFLLSPGELTARRLNDILQARGIKGVIFAPPPGFVKRIHFNWEGYACATFEHDSWRPLLHRVSCDDAYSISRNLREIERLGYARPGLIITQNDDAKTNYVKSGRMHVYQENLPTSKKIPVFRYHGPDITNDIRGFVKWVEKFKPDCILCGDRATLHVLNEAGIDVPADLGLVHLAIGPDVKDWTGIHCDRGKIGAAAVDLVINRMTRNEFGIPKDPREILIRGTWQNGKTTRKQSP